MATILGGEQSAKSVMRSVAVVEVLEAFQEGIELFDIVGQLVYGIELITSDAVAALDATIELQ